MEDLFTFNQQTEIKTHRPLSERARPEAAEYFYGQLQIFNEGPKLSEQIKADKVSNMILWGPPGSGKTSLANLISKQTKSFFIAKSAIDTGAKDLKLIGEEARHRLLRLQQKTILFIDEIHRLNKAQQDCLLPYMESGDLIVIGATTENPSFEVNSALLSRSQVIVFKSLEKEALFSILNRGLKILDPQMTFENLSSDISLNELLADYAGGDARRALNLLERVYDYFVMGGKKPLKKTELLSFIQSSPVQYDKKSEQHYNTISAFIKSVRGSDPDAALLYMSKMLQGGEDPLFIARRLVILASEDIGNAEPRALPLAISVMQAVDFVGMPEAAICLAQAVTFLASSPKSNKSYMALKKAQAAVEGYPQLTPPMNIVNGVTKLMKSLGYGANYQYDHDEKSGISQQSFMPEELKGVKFYEPIEKGHEKNLKAYLDWVQTLRNNTEK